MLNPQWRGFIETLLKEKIHVNASYRLDLYEEISNGSMVSFGPKYATYKNDRTKEIRLIIYSTFAGVSIQVLISPEPLGWDNDNDNNYADNVVEWLNQQITSSGQALHGCLNPNFNLFIFWRKFVGLNCVLKIARLLKYLPFEVPEGVMKHQLSSLLAHNFSNEIVYPVDSMNYHRMDVRRNISSELFPKIDTRIEDMDVPEIIIENRTFSSIEYESSDNDSEDSEDGYEDEDEFEDDDEFEDEDFLMS